MYIYDKIKDYLKQDIYPFHMPGHKRNPLFMPKDLLSLDMTEIPDMDVLATPMGILLEQQQRIADFYGAYKSYFLVNGSSAGIVAAICATCRKVAMPLCGTRGGASPTSNNLSFHEYNNFLAKKDSSIVIPRNAHISVYNGLVLSGATPYYVKPDILPNGLFGGVNPDNYKNVPYGATVLVVSPTYEGFVSDIKTIADYVHANDGILIVDEAHGAHFPFHKSFPKNALSQGADIVINSLHKTLPALSQCAVIHAQGNLVDYNRLSFYINVMQTSSPSYILMATSDYMLKMLWERPHLFEEYITRLKKLRDSMPNSQAPLHLFNAKKGEYSIYAIDPSKLLFNTTMHNAESISSIFASTYKIQMEMAKANFILAMTSVADTDKGFNRLKKAVHTIASARVSKSQYNKFAKFLTNPNDFICKTYNNFTLPEVIFTPYEAQQYDTIQVPLKDSVGRICAELITEYPPGIVTLAPGELITQEFLTLFENDVNVNLNLNSERRFISCLIQ